MQPLILDHLVKDEWDPSNGILHLNEFLFPGAATQPVLPLLFSNTAALQTRSYTAAPLVCLEWLSGTSIHTGLKSNLYIDSLLQTKTILTSDGAPNVSKI